VESFPEKPLLQTTGWLPRTPLSEAVYFNGWGQAPSEDFTQLLRSADKS
jgi:5,6-dimethylbenzimidazole synthase